MFIFNSRCNKMLKNSCILININKLVTMTYDRYYC